MGTGAGLLSDHSWDGILTAAVAVAAALLTALVVGVVQARRMTRRLRAAALSMPGDPQRGVRVRHGARAAALLRATIGLLSLALIALGALLAT